MQFIDNQTFGSDSWHEQGESNVYESIQFHNCVFQGCSCSMVRRPGHRSVVRNVQVINCSQRGSCLGSAILQDVLVDGFDTNKQLFQAWGAVFDRVTVRGRVGRIMLSSAILPGVASDEEQQAFDAANAEFYRKVKWALDISAAECTEFCIRGVPGYLIRRDPETQVLITRERALAGVWRGLDYPVRRHHNLNNC